MTVDNAFRRLGQLVIGNQIHEHLSLHTYLPCAIRMHSAAVFFIQSLTSSVHLLLGLPLAFLPYLTLTIWGGALPPYAEASSGPNVQPHT